MLAADVARQHFARRREQTVERREQRNTHHLSNGLCVVFKIYTLLQILTFLCIYVDFLVRCSFAAAAAAAADAVCCWKFSFFPHLRTCCAYRLAATASCASTTATTSLYSAATAGRARTSAGRRSVRLTSQKQPAKISSILRHINRQRNIFILIND